MISTITWNNNTNNKNNSVIMDPIKLSISTTNMYTKENNSFDLSEIKYRDLKRARLNNPLNYYAICSFHGNNSAEHPHEEEKESKRQRLGTHDQLFPVSENMMQNFYPIPVQYVTGAGAADQTETERAGDLAILQFQSFFDNIKIFFSHNSAVYESALKYILEFITIFLKDLAAKGVNLSTVTEEDLQSYSSVINGSLQKLQVHVSTIFCGYQPLILEFASHCYHAKKMMELKSIIGYELYALSKIKRKTPAEEVKLSWQAFTRYLSLVRETLPPLEFFSWLVSVEQVHHVALNTQCDLHNKLQLLNNAAGYLHCFPAAVRNILLELYPLPVPTCVSPTVIAGVNSVTEGFESGYCIDDRSDSSDQRFRKLVKKFVDALLSTFGRAHYQIFRYLYEIIHPFFSVQSNEGFYSMVASLRVLFKHTRVTLECCLDFIRKQFLYKFYTYVANSIFTSMRSGTDLKLKIDDITLEKNRNEFFSQVSERSQAGLVMDESAEAHLSFLVVMQDLQCVYSVHHQGLGSAGIVAVLQRMNEVISKSKDEKIIPKIFTLFPLEAKTAQNLSTNLPKAVAPLLLWTLPSRDMANQALLITKLITDSSQSIQAARNNINGYSSAFAPSSAVLPVPLQRPPTATARTSAGRLIPMSFTGNESAKQVGDDVEICTSATAVGKKPAVAIVPITNVPSSASSTTTTRLSPVGDAPMMSKKFPIEVTTAAPVPLKQSFTIVSLHDDEEDSAMRVLCNLAAIAVPCLKSIRRKSIDGNQQSTGRSNNPSSGKSNKNRNLEVQPSSLEGSVTTLSGPFRFEDLKVSYEALKMHAPASVNGEQVQLSYKAALLRKLESTYNELILDETTNLKSRSSKYLDCNGRCTSWIPLKDGTIIRVNKDDVRQWIEQILRHYTFEK